MSGALDTTERLVLPVRPAADERNPPPHGDRIDAQIDRDLNRDRLRLKEWLNRELPPRDYLLGRVLSTTSRWLLFGETGVGKTLFALDLAGAISAGKSFLSWKGQRKARVMYIDGELPAETFKERMKLIAAQYGPDSDLFGYCRDDLGDDNAMPPLNTPEGEKWLMREVDAIKPDLIVFDAIMSLLGGNMREEDSWEPVKPLVRRLSKMRIAQIWVHHTGHEAGKSYGTKTREWEMDTVVSLAPEGDVRVRLEFKKARLRTPETKGEFDPLIIYRGEDGWASHAVEKTTTRKRPPDQKDILQKAFEEAYHCLADGVEKSFGFDDAPVLKVQVDAIREELKRKGYLEAKETGGLTSTSRSDFGRAKLFLLGSNKFVEDDGLIWKV